MRNWSLYHCDGVEDILKLVKNLRISRVWNFLVEKCGRQEFSQFTLPPADSHLSISVGVLRPSIDFSILEMRLLMIQSPTSPRKCTCTSRTVYPLVALHLASNGFCIIHVSGVM